MHTRSGTHYISRCKQLASWCDVLGLLHPSVFAATDEITTARQGTCSVLNSLAHFGSRWLDFLAAAVNIIEREGPQIGNAARVSGLKEQLNHIRASFAQRYTTSLAELLGVGGAGSLLCQAASVEGVKLWDVFAHGVLIEPCSRYLNNDKFGLFGSMCLGMP